MVKKNKKITILKGKNKILGFVETKDKKFSFFIKTPSGRKKLDKSKFSKLSTIKKKFQTMANKQLNR
jgi:hypothetical protein